MLGMVPMQKGKDHTGPRDTSLFPRWPPVVALEESVINPMLNSSVPSVGRIWDPQVLQ